MSAAGTDAAGPVAVVLPLRSAVEGKSRLASVLDAGLRGALIRAMLRDVVDALHAAEVEHILVAAGDGTARAFAASLGLESCADPPWGTGLDDAVGAAIARVPHDNTLLVVMPDLPLLKPEDVLAVAAAPADVRIVTTAGCGTGVLACRSELRIATAYGERSGERHIERSAAAGASCAELWLPNLALDVDTVSDLRAVLGRPDLGPAVSALSHRLVSALAKVGQPPEGTVAGAARVVERVPLAERR